MDILRCKEPLSHVMKFILFGGGYLEEKIYHGT